MSIPVCIHCGESVEACTVITGDVIHLDGYYGCDMGGRGRRDFVAEVWPPPLPESTAAGDVRLLASAMRKVLLSEDMWVDDGWDRLRLDGHVHGGVTADELAAVRRVTCQRPERTETE